MDYVSLQCKSCDGIDYRIRQDGWVYFGYAMCAEVCREQGGAGRTRGVLAFCTLLPFPVSACQAGKVISLPSQT